MSWTRRKISEFSGRRNLEGYTILCYAVEAAQELGIECLRMSDVLKWVQRRMGGKKSINAINKALSRAITDMWDHGNRAALTELCGHDRTEKPSPKELIIRLAETMNETEQEEV